MTFLSQSDLTDFDVSIKYIGECHSRAGGNPSYMLLVIGIKGGFL